jgi:glucosyl-dolichyl phosphate glucuronosyltransferase
LLEVGEVAPVHTRNGWKKIMNISVIIPTYKRPKSLLLHLRSLQEQTLSSFEIIVVDNAADTEIERIVAEFNRTARIPVHYVPEPRLGVVHARHTGAQAAGGDILVFTDDDQTSEPAVLQAYANAFAEHPEMAAAGGPIRIVWESPPPKWLIEYIGQAKMFPLLGLVDIYDEFRLDPKGFFFSGNMAIRREVLFQVGGFNPELVGDLYFGDGEVGLYQKLWQRHMLIGYVPDAVMYHYIPPQRMTVEYFRRRMANEGAAEMYTRYHHGIPDRLHLFKHAAAIAAKNSKCWLGARLLRGRTDRRSVDFQMNAARTQSQVKYLLWLMFDKELRSLVLKKDWLNEPCA